MSLRIVIFILFIIFNSHISANRTNRNLNLQQLQNRCLTHQSTAAKSYTCLTQKKLKMQITRGVENGVFYCMTYEKNTGNVYGFDILTIELHPDYDLQYSGANVIDYEYPSFKLYDVRVTEEYKGRFAIYSNNTSFRIHQVTINNESQSCTYGKGKNRQMWPEPKVAENEDDDNSETTPKYISKSTSTSHSVLPLTTASNKTFQKSTHLISTTSTTTTELPITTTLVSLNIDNITTISLPIITTIATDFSTSTESSQKYQESTTEINEIYLTSTSGDFKENSDKSCGIVRKIVDFKSFSLPYNPGEFPFVATIFQTISAKLHLKCTGTIISSEIILTSVNCLLDRNSRLILEDDLVIYVAQYTSSIRNSNSSRKYYVEKITVHENFNYFLDNNLAALKLKRSIEFDYFTQPICLPKAGAKMKDSFGKVIGFGKSSMITESDFIIEVDESYQTFIGNSASSSENTDLGSGLYNNDENNSWFLIGICSYVPLTETPVTFTNIIYFIDWIEKLIN